MSLNQAGTYALSTILPVLASVAVLARMRVRMLQKAEFKLDDWTACAGLIVMWVVAGVIIGGTAKGLFGTHTLQDPKTGAANRTPKDFENVEYMQITLIISIFAIGLIKLSVVLLYRRIFSISRSFNIYSYFLLALITAWTIAFLGANIFQCGSHPAAAWTSVKQLLQYCDDTSGATAALALTDLIMDLMIIAAPMPIVWRMQMSLSQKLQVTSIFTLGLFATAASAVRAYILLIDSYGTTLSFRDIQGENTKVVVWTLVEIVAGEIGCCLPTLRPMFANTSFGSFLGTIFSVLSISSHSSQPSKHDINEKLTVVTIGGSGASTKDSSGSVKDSMRSSLSLNDVGNLV
ncbi:hypothetical protein HBI81_140120 [Parastagonospora nodorum]|nr:hypothetical protein HBI06_220770 [Parastagonospora nodorum]KAH4242630.1 hypothetical protein HBI05_087450 [Parastagonospora nodorum]KAH5182973.1 hypothetical protein HBH76_151300 [Parastagonospora nodorum]KAH6440591.1 hypothetical protein HBI59_132210 [Parastagonospora nodorum]KAH6523809.1 hypothetical protein HBI81_140120 [Parastagonospora nodorum]